MNLSHSSNDEVSIFLAARIRSERLRQGYSQATLAKLSNIPLRTYKRIELSGQGSIYNLILILRVLGRIRVIEALFPTPTSKSHQNVVDRVKAIASTKHINSE